MTTKAPRNLPTVLGLSVPHEALSDRGAPSSAWNENIPIKRDLKGKQKRAVVKLEVKEPPCPENDSPAQPGYIVDLR